ncbi:MAG: choice-of-anchor J domain-containing protein [Candidatus Cloacimonetes bacterium]|nr:choice-of-anchor J domain-containing protein [Candidatus Cloacimonadota bacterium]
MICATNWNNGLNYAPEIDGYYWDFGNGYVPFFAVIGAYNVLMYGDNSQSASTAMIPQAIDSFNDMGVVAPIANQILFFGDVETYDVSEIFVSPNGDVTVTIDDNTNPAVAEATLDGDILTITAQNSMGQTMITLMGDDGVMTATNDFYVTVLDPNPNTETLEFALEDTPTQANYPNNPNPYDDTWIDFGWTSVTVEEDAAIISMSITGDLFSDNYPTEGSLHLTSPDGTDIIIMEGFTSGTNNVEIEITDFITQPCAGEWIIHFVDSYGDGGHGLYDGTFNITIPGTVNPDPAPTNLEAAVTDDDVHLSWEYSDGSEPVTLAWDSGINDDGIGLTSGGSFVVASRWTPTELVNYHTMPINTIRMYLRGVSTSYVLKVWTGANAGTEVLSQPLTGMVMEAWNDVTLDTPVIIDAADELWFGYTCDNQPAGEYPAGCDAGPAIAGFGDMISMDGASWDPLSGYGLDYNWNLQAIANGRTLEHHSIPEAIKVAQLSRDLFSKGNLGAENTRDRDLLGFRVWRDGDELAYLEDTGARSYDDMDLADGTYEYYVTAVYDDNESDPSNTVEVVIDTGVMLDPPVGLEVTDDGMVSWYPPGTGGELIYEGFETWPPVGWLFLDEDVDGYEWDDGGALGLDAYEGSGLAYSASYDNTVGPLNPDNWLISPAIELSMPGQIQYYVCAQDAAWAGEHYGVYISTTGTDPADFDLLFEETMTARSGEEKILPKGTRVQGAWYERCVSTEGYTGTCYIAFRHFNVTDMFYLDLDEVTVSQGMMRPLESYNVYLDENLVGNTTENSYQLTGLSEGVSYEVGLTAVYTEGESDVITADFIYYPSATNEELPGVTALVGNYPNPFNPECTIAFSLADNAPVELNIYNARGQFIRTLVKEDMEAGSHQVVWNGTDENGNNVASGIYYYKMNSGKFTSSKKMVLMK